MKDERQISLSFLGKRIKSSLQIDVTTNYLILQAQVIFGVEYSSDLGLQAREFCFDVQHAIPTSKYLGIDIYFKNYPIQ